MSAAEQPSFKSLGHKSNEYSGLEVFPKPEEIESVTMRTDEVTALCPVTGQPDWYVVEVIYKPDKLCIESKTFKLFVQSLRNKGEFCEALACTILREVDKYARPRRVEVIVRQKPRGGVGIDATASRYEALQDLLRVSDVIGFKPDVSPIHEGTRGA